MKKLISLVLIAVMALGLFAVAEAPASPTLDVDTAEVVVENPDAEGVEDFFLTVAEADDEEAIEEAQEVLSEIAEAESVEEYFGDIADEIKEITGNDTIEITEVCPIIVGNYKEEFGSVKFELIFPTEYAEGQKLAALININDDWTVVEAEGTATGSVVMTLEPETLLAIQANGGAVLALAA